MAIQSKPAVRPANSHFSSGPCAKRPGWSPEVLAQAYLGRSHRSSEGKARLKLAIDKTRSLLGVPDDYACGIVPASDTGAFELAMWTMLGARGVDVLAWESFGAGWVNDAVKQLQLEDCRTIEAGYGELPDLSTVDFDHDVLFTSNGTTSGVRIPDYDWIASDRAGLTFADATSAAFAQPVDWGKGRCPDVFLAKGHGRRGRARHARAFAAGGRPARDFQAAAAIAEDLPADEERFSHDRRVRR